MIIRIATKRDIPSLIRIGEACRLESTVYYPPHDIDVVTASVARCLSFPDTFTTIVAEDTDVFGFVHGCVGPRSFTPVISASIELFMVMPGKRGFRPAKRLLDAFTVWAVKNSAGKIVFGSSMGTDLDLLLERFGYECIGKVYEKNVYGY